MGHFYSIYFLFIFVFVYCAHTFQHPGVFVSKEQLYYVKSQVENKQDPFYTAYMKALSSNYSNLHYSPQGPPDNGVIDCDIGCSADDYDGIVAYLQSLLWVITGNKQYASNSINLLNWYASRLKKYNNTNAPVQAAWSALKWTRAAEIIRYSDAGWDDNEVQAYEKLLQEVYLPLIIKGSGANGNWELSMIEAMMGIAVFTSDSDLFTHAVDFWKQRVPAYYYYEPEDGTKPNPAPRGYPSWYNQTVFNSSVNGICQETCRDLGHTQMGTGSAINAAETARIQGIDLYGSQEERLMVALEFNTNLLMRVPVPEYVCGGKVSIDYSPTFEVAYNHFHNRLGYSLPHTWDLILTHVRPMTSLTDGPGIYVWETLTHGGSPPK